MPTAKLWWNGTEWKPTDTYWLNHNSTASLGFGVKSTIKIIAYDDATIWLKATLNPSAAGGAYSLSGNRSITANGSNLLTLGDGNRDPAEVDVTNNTTFGYSGNVAVYKMEQGVKYGNASNISGSTTITSPFCTIAYNLKGGSGTFNTETVCKNVDHVLPTAKPTKTGYSFQGWDTSSSATTVVYAAGSTIRPTGDITLYAVWKAELTTITAPTGTIGSALTITLTQQGSSPYSYKHTLKWTINGTTRTIATNLTSTSAQFTYSWTPDIATIVPLYTDRSVYSCILTCETYNGSTLLGSKTKTINLNVPQSCGPSLSGSITKATGTQPAGLDAWVRGKSKPRFNYSATPQYDATIVSWSYKVNGVTTTVQDSSTARDYTHTSAITSNQTLKITVTDSRGLSSTDTLVISSSFAYTAPQITNAVLTRALSDGTIDPQGEYLKVTATISIQPLSSLNTHKYSIQYRKEGVSAWTTAQAETDTSGYADSLSWLSGSNILDQSETYEVRLNLKDYYGTTRIMQTVSTAAAILDFHTSGKGIAFGKVSEVPVDQYGNVPQPWVEIASDWNLVHGSKEITEADHGTIEGSNGILPIAHGGTGATSADAALTNLGLAYIGSISGGTSVTSDTFHVPNSFRGILAGFTPSTARQFLFLISAGNTGNLTVSEVHKGSGISYSTSANTLTITKTASSLTYLTLSTVANKITKI